MGRSSVADPVRVDPVRVDPVHVDPVPVDLRVLEAPAWAASLSAAGTASTVAGASRARKVLKNANVVAVPSRVQQQAEAERKAQVEAERLAELRETAAAARAAGYRTGVEETLAAGQDAALRGAAALERLADAVEGQRQAEVDVTAETVVTAAFEIAEWVLRRELSDGGRSLLTRLEAGMTALLPSPPPVSPCPATTTRSSPSGRRAAAASAPRSWPTPGSPPATRSSSPTPAPPT